MNYFNPNYLNNYPYNYTNPYAPQPQPQQFVSQSLPPQSQQPQTLNGKIVDSADVVKATEVPIGGYGIFPKADLSEIYIKSWNNNGTTSIITFQPVMAAQPEQQQDSTLKIIERLNVLDAKIDSLIGGHQPIAPTVPVQGKKKEVNVNDY